MTVISFSVIGQPIPQGSMNAFYRGGKTVMVHSKGKALTDWRKKIAETAKPYFSEPIQKPKPVCVTMFFTLHRAKSNKNTYPTTRPDLDKLVRAVMDALTGVCFEDDSQVTWISAEKFYDSEHDGYEGVSINITNE